MRVILKYFVVALLCFSIFSISAVSAEENITFIKSNENDVSIETLSVSSESQEITLKNDKSLANDTEEILNTDSTTFLDIQNKINNASDGGTIYLDGKTYTASSPTGIEVDKNLTIIGGSSADDAAHATLDAKGLTGIFNLKAKNIFIKGINFINSNNSAITGYEIDNIIITDCNFVNNSDEYHGGAIMLGDISNLTIRQSSFNGNRVPSEGGAIYFSSANATLEKLSFSGNSVGTDAGAVFGVVYQNGSIINCNFENNVADAGGAMGVVCFGAQLNIMDSTFKNNGARNLGGALLFMGDNVGVDNCTFEGNSALDCGALGGHANNANVTNSRFINNHANNSAGALFCDINNGIVSGNEFRGNSANMGGAIYTHGAGVNITGNSFVNNTAFTAGSVIWIDGPETSFLDNTVDNPNNAFYVTNSTNLIYNNVDPSQMQPVTKVIEIENLVGVVGGYLQLQVRVHDSRGNPLFGNVNGFVGGYPYYAHDERQLANGQAVLNFEMPDAPGIFDLTVEWSRGSGIWDYLTYNAQVLVINMTQLDNDSVNVTLPENSTGNVTFSFGDKTFAGALSNNSAVVDFTGLPNGNYMPEFKYANFTGTVPVTIQNSPKGAVITADDVTVKVNELIKIPVSVRDTDGNLVGGAIVYCNVSSINYTDMGVLTKGQFEFAIPAQNSPRVLDAVISFGNYNKTVKITILDNVAPVYKISSNRDVSVIYSGKATYRVLVTKDGKPAAGESVTFTFNGKRTVVKSDANGYASLKLNTKVKVKTYTIKTTYNGVSVSNKVKVTQVIKASNKKVKKSAKVTKVKVSLKKVNGKYLSKKVLKIKFNKKTYKVKTNKKGVGTWKVKKSMLKKLKVGKKVKYTVTYGKATLTKKLTIRR